MQFDEAFWVGVSFVTFLVLVFKPLSRFVAGALDKRSQQIEKDLAEAARLREEAQALLAAYQQKQDEIAKEAQGILERAKEEAQRLQSEAEAALKTKIEERTQRAHDKIAQEEAKAVQAIQQQVVDAALAAAQQILTQSMGKDADEALIKSAIADAKRLVH